MSKFKINIENMYGLNNRESKKVDFECDSNCNIVYGVNAVGKSSVADSITHILNNTKYLPRLTDDSKEFSLKIEFDKCKVEYNNSTKDDELSNLNVRDKIYVFNKFYIKNNMSSNTNTGGNIQIGIRIEEKRKKEEQNLKSLKKCSDNFKDLTKNSNYPSAMKNYKEGSLLGTFFKNEPAPYVKKFLESLEKNKMSNDCSIYNENDFYKDTLQQYTKYNIEMGYINEELIEKIKEQKVESLYNINNVKDEKFYEMVISYLENYNDPICPICHNEADMQSIKQEIEKSLKAVLFDKHVGQLNNIYSELEKITTPIANQIKINIENIIKCIYDKENIEKMHDILTNLIDNYDYIIANKLNLYAKYQPSYTEIIENEKVINEINEENKNITNFKFIEILQNNVNLIFKNDDFKIGKKYVNNEPIIEIKIHNKNAPNGDINNLFEILSESQKTKLSLAFFISVICYKHLDETSKKNILCVIDDPIDSYDSISKYEISNVLFDFLLKRGEYDKYSYECSSLVLTHSIEFIRIINGSYKSKELAYYLMSEKLIYNIKKHELIFIEGDLNLLNKILKKNNVKTKNLIAVAPIIRELASQADNSINKKENESYLNIDGNRIEDLYKKISNNIIHGLHYSGKKINEYVELIESYTTIKIDKSEIEDVTIKQYIETEIENIKKSNSYNFLETMINKNIMALYIRAGFDRYLSKIIKDEITQDKSYEDIHEEYKTIGQKLTEVREKSPDLSMHNKVIEYIRMKNIIFNDFAHSVNSFFTPLIDVKTESLLQILDEFFKLEDEKYGNVMNFISE